MPLTSRIRANAGLVVAMLLVLAAGLLAMLSTDRAFRYSARAGKSQETLRELNRLLAHLENAETAQRGYILTGDGAYRADLREAELQARQTLQRIAADREDLPAAELGRTGELVGRRLELLEQVTATYQTSGLAAASVQIRAGAGSATMDTLRAHIAMLQREEEAQLAGEQARGLVSEGVTRALLAVTVLLGLASLGFAAWVVNRELLLRRRREEELRAAIVAADAASRAKSEFLATVSHEIRTPLNAVLGMTELLRETRLSSEQHEFTRTVHTNAEALVTLVGDLLDSFKIDAGQIDLEAIPFDVREVVEGVGEIMIVRAEARELDFVVTVDPDVPRALLGDPNRLRQILMNLVGNALKFTEAGEVVVRARAEALDAEHVTLEIAVADTGIGIPEQSLERIFEPFVQAEASTTRRFGGTGLGLNIARSLTRLMGGAIRVASDLGRGSTFTVTIPFRRDGTGVRQPVADLAGVQVLLVTGSRARREGVQRQLEAVGASVVAVSDPVDALRHVERDGVEVVLVDDRLADWRDLVARLGRSSGRPVRAIVLCGLGSPLVASSDPDVAMWVFKPLREARLLEAVARAAGRHVLQPGQVAGPVAPLRERAVRPPRVLVAEDNPDNWTLVARALRAGGYAADLAPNGAVAVEMAGAYRYDLIFMDIEMPVMDGLEATRQIRRQEQAHRLDAVPIVAVTAHALEGFRERCVAAGADDYATKPIKPQQLVDLADQWVDPRPLVAIADDAPENHVLIRHFLRDEPYRLLSVHDGREAVNAFRSHRVAVMLMDMDMPEVDGYSAVREIRRIPDLRDVPVIAITGYTGADERAKCYAAGCTGYLAKPIRRGELIPALRTALGGAPQELAVEHPPAAELPRAAAPRPQGMARDQLARIGRLLNREDYATASTLLADVRGALLEERHHAALRLAEELGRSLQDRDVRSAVFWHSRLVTALREGDRLEALAATALLDSPVEARYDRVVRDVARRIGVPVALISLVDADRQFFKSQVGLAEPWASRRETPLSHSFCQHVVAAAEPFVVEDARHHPVVQDNMAIEDLGVIAYAGVPLVSPDGHALGSLCAIDGKPRRWSERDLEILRQAADEVEREMRRGSGPARPQPQGRSAAPVAVSPDEASPDPELAAFAVRFAENKRAEVERIDEWLASGSWDQIARVGHQVKGTAATFGFPHVGTLGGELERAARAQDADAVRRHRDALREALAGP